MRVARRRRDGGERVNTIFHHREVENRFNDGDLDFGRQMVFTWFSCF
jgi:hypothetical protein